MLEAAGAFVTATTTVRRALILIEHDGLAAVNLDHALGDSTEVRVHLKLEATHMSPMAATIRRRALEMLLTALSDLHERRACDRGRGTYKSARHPCFFSAKGGLRVAFLRTKIACDATTCCGAPRAVLGVVERGVSLTSLGWVWLAIGSRLSGSDRARTRTPKMRRGRFPLRPQESRWRMRWG